jgi:hypothetical protein
VVDNGDTGNKREPTQYDNLTTEAWASEEDEYKRTANKVTEIVIFTPKYILTVLRLLVDEIQSLMFI